MVLLDLSLRLIFRQLARDDNRSVAGAQAWEVFRLLGWERMVRAWDHYTQQTFSCWMLTNGTWHLHIFPAACELHPPTRVQWQVGQINQPNQLLLNNYPFAARTRDGVICHGECVLLIWKIPGRSSFPQRPFLHLLDEDNVLRDFPFHITDETHLHFPTGQLFEIADDNVGVSPGTARGHWCSIVQANIRVFHEGPAPVIPSPNWRRT